MKKIPMKRHHISMVVDSEEDVGGLSDVFIDMLENGKSKTKVRMLLANSLIFKEGKYIEEIPQED